ncbi:MAG TPA: DUF4159 domain-containing protein [Tepidisphaeraceae bacterium]|jgi:hypothetical protein|nr:DUF4159 domain-containing protein [Tepidisphaeraceae bacterium]
MRHKSTFPRFAKFVLGAAVALGTTRAASAAATVKEVDAAVDKAVAYLLSQQKPDGSWENGPRLDKPETMVPFVPSKYATYGGETAIVTYALLAAGQNPQSEPMKKAVTWLEHIDLHGTYAIGLRSQVWNLLPDTDHTKQFNFARDRDRDYEYFGRMMKGPNAGFYTYTYGADLGGVLAPGMKALEQTGLDEKSTFDRSNSQYAVLGAWAVEQAGAEMPVRYWEEEDLAWKNAQKPDGTWSYNNVVNPNMVYERGPDGKVNVRPMKATDHIVDSTPTMTCAGVATLYITQDYIMRAKAHLFDTCNGGVPNPYIEKGLAWLDKHIDQTMSLNSGNYHYTIYGIERIGVASGRKYIGGVDWFQKGAQVLVQTQNTDGSWNSTLHDTSFSILFLMRGRAPVMMNKLIYTNTSGHQNDPWDERPRDAANLAKWMGKHSIEGFLNWQLVDLKYPVEEFHDSPILYISGSEPLNLSNEDVNKLRLFVQQGGMILGNGDCGRKLFDTSFKKLGNRLFPAYEFRVLARNHPIFSEQYLASKWKVKPQLEGLSNGVRELMILIPDADPGRAWQNDSYKMRDELFQLGGNIFLYATGRENLRKKGDSYMVTATGEATRTIGIARIMAGDNPDPEPGGWPHLAAIMQNENRIHLDVHPVKLGTGDLAKYKIADLTGTTRLALNDEQRKELKAFVDGGGTLIVDAAGGTSAFADAAEDQLKQTFGAAATAGLETPLPLSHPAFDNPLAKVEDVHYRVFARAALVGNQKEPRIRGILAPDGARVGVFYSREDLTGGLVGEAVDGIVGYDPQSAIQLMRSMILYADGAGK